MYEFWRNFAFNTLCWLIYFLKYVYICFILLYAYIHSIYVKLDFFGNNIPLEEYVEELTWCTQKEVTENGDPVDFKRNHL